MDTFGENFLKPKMLDIEQLSEKHAVAIIAPLERGFGHTIGNALRRILLSSISGYAVTEIYIDQMFHDFSSIKGVQEEILEIQLNFRKLAISIKNNEYFTFFYIKKQGIGPVFASDIIHNNELEIINKKHILFHLTSNDIPINLRVKVERGCGFTPASSRKKILKGLSKKEFRCLFVDAYFNPIERVFYEVCTTRVKQYTDLDKLIIDIKTNGTIDPEKAIRCAATILVNQLSVFVNEQDIEKPKVKEIKPNFDPVMICPIGQLDLSVRSINGLKSISVKYIGDLVQKTEDILLKIPNFGKKSLEEIREILSIYGLSLGMRLDNFHYIKNINEKKNIKK